jgi:hypothetical protein
MDVNGASRRMVNGISWNAFTGEREPTNGLE